MKFQLSNKEFKGALHLVNQNKDFYDDKQYSRKMMAADQDEEFAQFFNDWINADDMSVQEADYEAFETNAENPNGLIATTEIFKNKNTLEMQAVVRSLKKGVPIKKVSITYPHPTRRQVQMQRKQFAVALAWGCTIHKSEGLTMATVVVDFVKQLHQSFQIGQGYVALSRVRSMEILYVKNFTDKCIKVNERVTLEIARLRSSKPIRPYCLSAKLSSTIVLMSLNIIGYIHRKWMWN